MIPNVNSSNKHEFKPPMPIDGYLLATTYTCKGRVNFTMAGEKDCEICVCITKIFSILNFKRVGAKCHGCEISVSDKGGCGTWY